MKHGADVSVSQEVYQVILAGFKIDFDLSKARHKGVRLSIVRILVTCRDDHSLTGERSDRSLGKPVDVGVGFMTIIDTAELDSLLSGLGERHRSSAALSGDPFIRHVVVLGFAA